MLVCLVLPGASLLRVIPAEASREMLQEVWLPACCCCLVLCSASLRVTPEAFRGGFNTLRFFFVAQMQETRNVAIRLLTLSPCGPQVRRFGRYVLGEGIEKRESNLAAEVAAATGQA